ncbi:MAG TPA: prolyl oligopeptidase family serine peptidase [Acidimicrobiales bacterium]|nr:prolyl oligopeptidase family serine peptidase [Acidimicrobiales bacterium]
MTEYLLPPDDIVALLDAPGPPSAYPSPDCQTILLADRWTYPPVERLARPWLGLAGVRVDPALGGRRRIDAITAMTIVTVDDATAKAVDAPEGSKLGPPRWSPDSRRFAFTREADHGIELWVGDARSGAIRRVPGLAVNDTIAAVAGALRLPASPTAFAWSRDGQQLLAAIRPVAAGEAPPLPGPSPSGPRVEETAGKHSELGTFQDLLRDDGDDEAFAWFARSQLAWINPATGGTELVGRPDLFVSVAEAPDGQYLAVTRLCRPFSHRVPYARFRRVTEVWTRLGEVAVQVADLPVADEVPRQGVPTGPRRGSWAENQDATLVWVEALDGGDPLSRVDHRERVMCWAAPFSTPPEESTRLRQRFVAWHWLPIGDGALVSEYDRDRRWLTTSSFGLTNPVQTWRVLFDRSIKDAYGDPGTPLEGINPSGRRLARGDGTHLWLRGQGANAAGWRPFLDRLDLRSGETERVFHSDPEALEQVVDLVDPGTSRLLIWRQTPQQPPNLFLWSPHEERQLSRVEDPNPVLTGAHRRIVRYRRADDVALSGTLYLPPGREPDDGGPRLPLLIWAYPEEFSDGSTAGQVRASDRSFLRVSGASPLILLLRGWAVLMNATMPVIGDPEHMNDTYIEQIVAGAAAAVDHLNATGVIDRRRVVAAGHSYGGFMTANLLAHTDLFAAGIARSGAYNRSLTPFGFQAERRSYWEVPELYHRVSPYDHADLIKAPLLLVHGAEDAGSNTYPLQSERLFQALQGLGGTARLVVLPAEEHGYRARESVLHVAAEMLQWVERHVPGPAEV